jgi:hypothetical protein
MPLQHQEHETGHDRRLQSTVARIVTTTRDVLKSTADVFKLADQSRDRCLTVAVAGNERPLRVDTVEKPPRLVVIGNIPTPESLHGNYRCVLGEWHESICRENARSGVFQQYRWKAVIRSFPRSTGGVRVVS